jgi:hypothetical protein
MGNLLDEGSNLPSLGRDSGGTLPTFLGERQEKGMKDAGLRIRLEAETP